MGIDAQLRSEGGEVLDAVGDSDMVLSRATDQHFGGTRLLRYLVRWGDTIFNQAQAADLSHDIAEIRRRQVDTPLSTRLGEVQRLVYRLSTETHSYLWFIGD